jgi:hypothetical protein
MHTHRVTTIHLCGLPGTIRQSRAARTAPYSCSTLLREGFTSQPALSRRPGGLLPHLFTLTPLRAAERYIFCGTGLIATYCPRHPRLSPGTPCPVKSGLSSLPSKRRHSGRLHRHSNGYTVAQVNGIKTSRPFPSPRLLICGQSVAKCMPAPRGATASYMRITRYKVTAYAAF